jgi:hypothetical protein
VLDVPETPQAEAAAQQDGINEGDAVSLSLAPDPGDPPPAPHVLGGVVGHTWSDDGGLMVEVRSVDEEDASYTDHVSVLVADHGCDILDDYLRATPDARNIKILGHRVDLRGTRILSRASLDKIISDSSFIGRLRRASVSPSTPTSAAAWRQWW